MLVVMGDLDIGPIPETIPTKEEIVGVMVKDTEVGLKRSTTITCSMLEEVLMTLGEVDICLRPSLLSPIIHVVMVDHMVFIVMVITKVYIGITSDNFMQKSMVD